MWMNQRLWGKAQSYIEASLATEETRDAHLALAELCDQLERSDSAGCFHCEVTFPVSAISEWIDDAETALCPVCGVDSVIGDALPTVLPLPGVQLSM